MTKTVAVIAAHPDDEVFGCGGTIARHTNEGDTVHAVFMSSGVGSRPLEKAGYLDDRKISSEKSAHILGLTSTNCLDFPDNCLDTLPMLDLVQALETVLDTLHPQLIYTHHAGDLNIDHRLTHEAVMTACRPQPSVSTKDILSFEVVSSTEWRTPGIAPFEPNVFVDISGFIEQKLSAAEAYGQELRSPPHSRNREHLTALARHRGLSIGYEYAEAFHLVRSLRN